MANLILGYSNLIDSATLSGGSWNAIYPLTHLKNRLLAKRARSSNALAASTLINIDLGSAKAVQAFGAIASNISSSGASYRLRGSNDSAFGSSLYDSGTLSANTQTPHVIIGLTSAITARYWRFEITDTGNGSGYVQLGRLFIGPALMTADNYSKGADLGYQSRSSVVQSVGGVEYFNKIANRRTFSFAIDTLTSAEAYTEALEVQRLADVTEEVLLITDTDDTTYRQQRHFLGRLSQLSPIKNPYTSLHQAAFEIVEIV